MDAKRYYAVLATNATLIGHVVMTLQSKLIVRSSVKEVAHPDLLSFSVFIKHIDFGTAECFRLSYVSIRFEKNA